MAKYRVETDKGVYEVETEEAPAAPNPSLNATMSARPQPQGIGAKVAQWAEDAMGDLRYGGDRTIVGTTLQKLGATPLHQGAPEKAAELMGSVPLGTLRMTKGAGEIATPGRRLEGVKDVAAGALQAAEIPLSFVAPEGVGAGHGAVATKALAKTGEGGAAVAEAAGKLIPSAKRAGTNFKTVAEATNGVPIDIRGPGKVADDIYDLAQRGGSMPKVIRDFLKRATDPERGALTFQEARDFYSNATRLSVDETKRLTPRLRFEVGRFTRELGRSLETAAGSVGQSERYQKAMREYHKAMKWRDFGEGLKDVATSTAAKAALGTAAGGYVASQLMK